MRLRLLALTVMLVLGSHGVIRTRSFAQDAVAKRETGYEVRRPVFGGACATCPWGTIGPIVKQVMRAYDWDIQICSTCAGGPRAARMVSGAMIPTPPENQGGTGVPTPNGPVDFGATGSQFLQYAYIGIHDFANDPEGPRKDLRLVAHIQEPTYFVIAVKAGLGITDLRQIVAERRPLSIVARTSGEIGGSVLSYYGLTNETIESFGGTLAGNYSRDADVDVLMGFGSLVNAPEYNMWYHATQKYDFNYLELAPDLRSDMVKRFYVEERDVPLGLLRGLDRPIPSVARTGTVIYGRTDMPEEFAYALAKAMDENKALLQWTHMNYFYDEKAVWKAFDVPLHPGAARYYREKGYMK